MNQVLTWTDLAPASAEVFLLAAACAVLLVDLALSDRQRWITFVLSIVALAGAAVLTSRYGVGSRTIALFGHYVADPMGTVLKLVNYAVVAVALLYSRDYLDRRGLFRGEYFVLALFAVLGMNVMISAGSLLSMYLGIEILSVALYVLAALQRRSVMSNEAGFKYLILGAFSSAFLLYGMALLYGSTGTTNLTAMAERIGAAGDWQGDAIFWAGWGMLLIGLGFKIAMVPFHMWTPDVYEGSPAPMAGFMAAGVKAASFAALMRVVCREASNQ